MNTFFKALIAIYIVFNSNSITALELEKVWQFSSIEGNSTLPIDDSDVLKIIV